MVTLQLNIEPQYADQVELVSNVSLHLVRFVSLPSILSSLHFLM
jgi:hypothetical protein